MHMLDANIQSLAPMIMVPHFEALPAIEPNSHRYLAASDGIYIEVSRPWIHGVFRTGSVLRLPYGKLNPHCDLKITGDHIKTGLQRFMATAEETPCLECAAWLLYSVDEQALTGYFQPPTVSQTEDSISYRRPIAQPALLPVIDCHSHGSFVAYFSRQDDADDLEDDLKISVVFGNLNRGTVSVAARVVGLGVNVNISDWVCSLVQTACIPTKTSEYDGSTETLPS